MIPIHQLSTRNAQMQDIMNQLEPSLSASKNIDPHQENDLEEKFSDLNTLDEEHQNHQKLSTSLSSEEPAEHEDPFANSDCDRDSATPDASNESYLKDPGQNKFFEVPVRDNAIKMSSNLDRYASDTGVERLRSGAAGGSPERKDLVRKMSVPTLQESISAHELRMIGDMENSCQSISNLRAMEKSIERAKETRRSLRYPTEK